jgi:hypothetical protein
VISILNLLKNFGPLRTSATRSKNVTMSGTPLSSHLAEHGFVMNPYDVCCMNKEIDGYQCTIVWHVDDLKISHVDKEVVATVIEIIEKEFAKHKPLTVQRALLHDYIGMTIDFSKGKSNDYND